MTFPETLTYVVGLLFLERRVSYRRLRQELQLDDEALEALRYELVVAKHLAVDENAEVLVWTGGAQDALDSGTKDLVVDGSSTGVGTAAFVPIARSGAGQPSRQNRGASKAVEAERRQLTVMFCDLVGSTALSTRMDPEDLRDLITSFQDECRQAIQRYDGFIARYMGDGLLVYFGYPQAHENDAERATRAGLDIVESMASLNGGVGKTFGAVLKVRVGVATGPVVVGDTIGEGAAEEAAVVGETPNLAARLQGIAQPNQVVIAPMTQRIVGDIFTFDDLGTHELKGIAEPVQAWRVAGAADIEVHHETRRQKGSSPLVGRQEELGLLLRAWETCQDGHGQVVLIQGEPGVGKSRLLEALREPLVNSDYTWVSIRCSPYYGTTPLYPVIEHFKRVMRWRPQDDDQSRLEKLEVALRGQSVPLEEVVPLYADLMSLSLPEDRYPASQIAPQQKREATLDAIVGWLFELADGKPVLQVWEDLHWADPTTLELLRIYIEQSPTVSMLNVLTYRPEFAPPWSMRSHMTPITLNRLERPEVEAFVGNLAGGKFLPNEVLEHIVAKADGVPLYVEELTKTILESGLLQEEGDRYLLDGKLEDLQIPSTLQDSLMARLDRVPMVRELAQLGAVIGREFAYEMVHLLTAQDESKMRDGLEQLVDGELVYQRGRGRRARYIFKHALIQDVAYQSLLRRTRQQYHSQVAKLLETQFPEMAEQRPELVAHHYEEGGNAAEALANWREAAQRTSQQGAHEEALEHLAKAIRLVELLPADAARDEIESDLQLERAGSMRVVDRFDEAFEALDRAELLAITLDDASRLSAICFLRGNLYFPIGNLDGCLAQHERARSFAHKAENVEQEARALSGLGDAYYLRGRMLTAFEHFNRCVELSQEHDLAAIVAANRQMRGNTRLWGHNDLLGALEDSRASGQLARDIGEPRAELVALGCQCHVLSDLARYDELEAPARRSQQLVEMMGARRFQALVELYSGQLEAIAGNRDRAQRLLQDAYDICVETGVNFMGAWVLGILALVACDESVRKAALRDGIQLLDNGCVSHNYFYFYRSAIELSLEQGEWDEVDRYAAALERYTRAEPLSWTDFFIARGRALARYGRDPQDVAPQAELARLRDQAVRAGHQAALARINMALET